MCVENGGAIVIKVLSVCVSSSCLLSIIPFEQQADSDDEGQVLSGDSSSESEGDLAEEVFSLSYLCVYVCAQIPLLVVV